jgi:hypothetical protein
VRNESESATLAEFAANLRFEDIPEVVLRRTGDLFLDWFGAALAGRGARPIEAIDRFASKMACGAPGRSEVLINRRSTTPFFAATVNAAASHFVLNRTMSIAAPYSIPAASYSHPPWRWRRKSKLRAGICLRQVWPGMRLESTSASSWADRITRFSIPQELLERVRPQLRLAGCYA